MKKIYIKLILASFLISQSSLVCMKKKIKLINCTHQETTPLIQNLTECKLNQFVSKYLPKRNSCPRLIKYCQLVGILCLMSGLSTLLGVLIYFDIKNKRKPSPQ